MWPMLDSTTKSGPRYPAMVFAFAGDSTITNFFGTVEHVSAGGKRRRSTSPTRRTAIPWRTHAGAVLQLRGDRLLAGAPGPLSPGGARRREPACRGRIRARGKPHVELRPVAAGPAHLAEAAAFLHGQGGALQPDPRAAAARRRRLPGAPRRGRRRGRPEGGRDLPDRRRGRHVPGGDAADEGPAEEVRAQ